MAAVKGDIEGSTSVPSIWEEGREEAVQKCIVPLSYSTHKGSSGRVGVLGGSERYTGAPYYAAMASLKVGSDLATVFCAQEAAVAIKCYSPELMVAPVWCASEFENALETKDETLQEQLVDRMVQEVVANMNRLHVLVVGPGMGRCPLVMKAAWRIMMKAKEQDLSIVVDADGLFLLSLEPYQNLFKGYTNIVLTPNVVEYKRLQSSSGEDLGVDKGIVIKKGKNDAIMINGSSAMECHEVGGMKRSGGIGDILAGTLGTFMAWNTILRKDTETDEARRLPDGDRILSCWSATCVVKRATKQAFDLHRRSMTAPDVLQCLGSTFDDMTRSDAR